MCGTHKLSPSLIPTATRTASSSRRKPQLAIGRARSQSPLSGACAARNLAVCDGSTREDSISARSVRKPVCHRMTVFQVRDQVVDKPMRTRWISTGQGMCQWHRDTMAGCRPEGEGCSPPKPVRQELRAMTPFAPSGHRVQLA